MPKHRKQEPTAVKALIRKHIRDMPPIPPPPLPGVIPSESLWDRFRRRRK